jgi:hypothetical protein
VLLLVTCGLILSCNLIVKRHADVQAVKKALNSAIGVLTAVEGFVHFFSPKVRFSQIDKHI